MATYLCSDLQEFVDIDNLPANSADLSLVDRLVHGALQVLQQKLCCQEIRYIDHLRRVLLD